MESSSLLKFATRTIEMTSFSTYPSKKQILSTVQPISVTSIIDRIKYYLGPPGRDFMKLMLHEFTTKIQTRSLSNMADNKISKYYTV